MLGKECRGIGAHRPSSVDTISSAEIDVWPNVASSPSDTCWRARHHRRRPIFPWVTKPRGMTKKFPLGTKPWGRKKSLTCWRAQKHRRHPSFRWGKKTKEQPRRLYVQIGRASYKADERQGLYTLLPAQGRRADVSGLY